MVPSFWVRNRGALMPLSARARTKASVVVAARPSRAAFSSVTFSRSSRPRRPSSWLSVTATCGAISAMIAAASSSACAVSGENTALIAALVTPESRIFFAASRMAAASNGTIGRPSYSWPPRIMWWPPSTMAARSSGQSQNGGSEALAGRPIRTAAILASERRWTTALVKWVVPTITESTALGSAAGLGEQLIEGGLDAAGHVQGGGRLHRGQHGRVLEQHRIRVGAADVDTDLGHLGKSGNSGRKGRS